MGNIVTGDDKTNPADADLWRAAVPSQFVALSQESIKEACWTVSNITAGNKQQIEAVINMDIIPILIEILKTDSSRRRRRRPGRSPMRPLEGQRSRFRYFVRVDYEDFPESGELI